ncbi:MAG: hypothetical protein AAFX99_08465 [Myxococcota bacterium]
MKRIRYNSTRGVVGSWTGVGWMALGMCVLIMGCTADQRPEASKRVKVETGMTVARSIEEPRQVAGDPHGEVVPEDKPTPKPKEPPCVPFEPVERWPELASEPHEPPLDVVLCDSKEAMESLAKEREPMLVDAPNSEADVSVYDDPIVVRGGMALYRHAMDSTVREARLSPILFGRTPPLSAAQLRYFREHPRAAREAQAIWSQTGRDQWTKIRSLVGRYSERKPEHLRMVLLRSGFLFVEEPYTAQMMFRRLRLDHLFSPEDTTIVLQRGSVLYRLERRGDDYVHTQGRRKGARASLLVFDRVALTEDELTGSYAWDIDRLRTPMALRSFKVRSLSVDRLEGEASLRHGPTFPGSVFVKGGRTQLVLVVPSRQRQDVLDQVRIDRRDAAIMEGILQAGEQMVDERLRFDEPRTEEGQQDGMLREVWLRSYAKGRRGYVVNGDWYAVYDRQGRPYVPQVCVDFILDSPERWAGRWWLPKSEPPGRTEGFWTSPIW